MSRKIFFFSRLAVRLAEAIIWATCLTLMTRDICACVRYVVRQARPSPRAERAQKHRAAAGAAHDLKHVPQ